MSSYAAAPPLSDEQPRSNRVLIPAHIPDPTHFYLYFYLSPCLTFATKFIIFLPFQESRMDFYSLLGGPLCPVISSQKNRQRMTSEHRQEGRCWGWDNSRAGRAFVLQADDMGLTSGIPYGPPENSLKTLSITACDQNTNQKNIFKGRHSVIWFLLAHVIPRNCLNGVGERGSIRGPYVEVFPTYNQTRSAIGKPSALPTSLSPFP